MNLKGKYLSSAFVLLLSTVTVKVISAIYKIPLTAFIGGVGRGYFAYAYNLCLPIHAVTMGAFPIALSKLVSTYNSKGDTSKVLSLKKGSFRMFSLVGFVGLAFLLCAAKPYSDLVAHSPKAIYTVSVLAPSVLFSCMGASYRGYFEGFLNMIPTAVSQTIDALFKMVFGLLFAKYSMAYLFQRYQATGMVLGTTACDEQTALSLIYPFTSACAMLGVTLGAFASLCFLSVYSKYHSPKINIRLDTKSANKELFAFSFPIMVSTCVQSVFQFLDTATIQFSLNKIDVSVLHSAFFQSLKFVNISNKDLPTYVFGVFSASLDFKNLVPGVTMALGISAVPAISRAFEQKNQERFSALVNSVYKYTVLLSSLGGIVLYVCSEEILNLFYGKDSRDIVVSSVGLVKCFALTVVFYSLAGTAVFAVQAVGLSQKSILPYAVSGVIRIVLNIVLVTDEHFVLYGAVVSGAVGYAVLTAWNIAVLCKYTKIKFDFLRVILLPFAVFGLTLYFCKILFVQPFLPDSTIGLIIIKAVISLIFYCILCFLCGMLNFKDFFCNYLTKKIH
ncbi:polysaccharide biosynthesis C-terminal domain-containing protein [uncultured Eubacterium sp.]|uniref:oligosaccharide flippase family protein n=1 Tax=uncultured Eubacterium sp. TaxID=165185 RepID=UPI0025FDB6AA|nr:polysaccharide biosynthesis C-terminal domain-containing protein [uncultured Eubacterium sp.]